MVSGYVGRRCQGRGAAGSRCGRGARRDQATPAGMGGCESSQSGRRVSFGLDEREQVRVLQGIRVRRPGSVVGPGDGGGEAARAGGGGSWAGEGSGREGSGLERCRAGRDERGKQQGKLLPKEEGRETWKAAGIGGWRSDGATGEWCQTGLGSWARLLSSGATPALDFHFQTLFSTLLPSSLLHDLVLPVPCALQAVRC